MSIWTTKKLDRDRKYIVLRHPLRGINNMINGVKFRNSYAVVEKDSKVYHHLKKIPVLKSSKEFPLTHLRSLNFVTRTSDIKMIYGQDVYIKFLKSEKDAAEAKEIAEYKAKNEAIAEEEVRRQEEIKEVEEVRAKIKEIAKQVKFDVNSKIIEKGKSEVAITVIPTEDSIKTVKKSIESLKEELATKEASMIKCTFKTKPGTLCKFDALTYSPSDYCAIHLLQDPGLEKHGIKVPNLMDRKQKKKFRKLVANKLKRLKKEDL